MSRPRVHPSAVVDPAAELADGVVIGPGSVVGSAVRLGPDTVVGAHVVLEGRVVVGARCRIGHGSVVGAPPQDLKFRPGTPAGVVIGDDTVIREHVTVHHATHEGGDTRIGAHCLLMSQCHVAHDCVLGDHVIVINSAGLTGHVVVEERATVGGLTGVAPFRRIGAFAYVGGCSKVRQDVPPFVIADGAPARALAVNVVGMRRGGIDAAGRRQVTEAFRVLYRSGLAPGAALARLRAEFPDAPLVARMVAFVESAKKGIVPGRRPDADRDAPDEEHVL